MICLICKSNFPSSYLQRVFMFTIYKFNKPKGNLSNYIIFQLVGALTWLNIETRKVQWWLLNTEGVLATVRKTGHSLFKIIIYMSCSFFSSKTEWKTRLLPSHGCPTITTTTTTTARQNNVSQLNGIISFIHRIK